MNREIKFRAWHQESKMMAYNLDLSWNIRLDCWSFISRTDFFHAGERFNATEKSANLMQFTGLKDQSGKEIYEGDLISEEMIDENGNSKWTAENYTLIAWRGSGFAFVSNPNSAQEWFEHIVDDGILDVKVIGNIHENPELLNK
jgi:uncharacterized phage protein (TIGR01671 family)